jgi:hypothetical protein
MIVVFLYCTDTLPSFSLIFTPSSSSPPHFLWYHRFSSPDRCMFVYIEGQYLLVKTVIFSAKLSRVDCLPLLSSPHFVSPRATVRSASKSRSLLSLISIVSVSSSLLSFVIASSACLDSQAYPYPSLLPSVTVRQQADSHGSIPMIPTAVSLSRQQSRHSRGLNLKRECTQRDFKTWAVFYQ